MAVLPPQSRIVLAFVNPPDVLRAVGRLAHEVPPGIQERAGRLHLGRGLACAPAALVVWPEVWVSQKQAVTALRSSLPQHHQPADKPTAADRPGAVAVGHRTIVAPHQPADTPDATDRTGAVAGSQGTPPVAPHQPADPVTPATDRTGAVALGHSTPPLYPTSPPTSYSSPLTVPLL